MPRTGVRAPWDRGTTFSADGGRREAARGCSEDVRNGGRFCVGGRAFLVAREGRRERERERERGGRRAGVIKRWLSKKKGERRCVTTYNHVERQRE